MQKADCIDAGCQSEPVLLVQSLVLLYITVHVLGSQIQEGIPPTKEITFCRRDTSTTTRLSGASNSTTLSQSTPSTPRASAMESKSSGLPAKTGCSLHLQVRKVYVCLWNENWYGISKKVAKW